MKLKRLNQHSIEDWDFETADWELSSDQYVSGPTSLYCDTLGRNAVLCRLAQSLLLPQGQMITSIWAIELFSSIFIFRAQTNLGTSNHEDNYSLRTASGGAVALWKTVDKVETNVGIFSNAYVPEQWTRLRVTWWNGINRQNVPALAVHLEKEVDNNWVSVGYVYDTENRWHDSAMNRCGVELRAEGQFLDDTEIWVPE